MRGRGSSKQLFADVIPGDTKPIPLTTPVLMFAAVRAVAVAIAVALSNFWIVAVAALLWLVGLVTFAYVSSVAGQVYRCALFLYASQGTIPEPYNLDLLAMAWKVKK